MDKMDKLLQSKKAVSVLVLLRIKRLKKTYHANVAKECNVTYSHIHHIMNRLRDLELIEKKRDPRETLIFLTKKGEKVADKIMEIQKILK